MYQNSRTVPVRIKKSSVRQSLLVASSCSVTLFCVITWCKMAAYDISKAIEEIESKSVESDLKLVSIRGILLIAILITLSIFTFVL